MRRIATALCAAGALALLGPASAGAFGPVGSFDGSGPGSGQFNHPQGAVFTGATVYVADTGNNRVPSYNPSGGFESNLAGSPGGPRDVAVPASGGAVVSVGPSQVTYLALGLLPLSWAQPGSSYGAAIDGSSTIYVSDTAAGVIRKYNVLGQPQGEIGAGQLAGPEGLTFALGSLYVAEPGAHRITKLDPATGSAQQRFPMPTYTIVAGGQTIQGQIEPHDVAVDGSGRVFAPDANPQANLLAIFGPGGDLQQIIGSPVSDPGNACHLSGPWGVAVSGTRLYVVSTGENAVRIFDDTLPACPVVNFGPGGGINPVPSGGIANPLASDRRRPKVKLKGIPKKCARKNFAFQIRARDDVLLKRLILLVNRRRVASQPLNAQQWKVRVKIPARRISRSLPRGASVPVLVEVRVKDATGKKARIRRTFSICG